MVPSPPPLCPPAPPTPSPSSILSPSLPIPPLSSSSLSYCQWHLAATRQINPACIDPTQRKEMDTHSYGTCAWGKSTLFGDPNIIPSFIINSLLILFVLSIIFAANLPLKMILHVYLFCTLLFFLYCYSLIRILTECFCYPSVRVATDFNLDSVILKL